MKLGRYSTVHISLMLNEIVHSAKGSALIFDDLVASAAKSAPGLGGFQLRFLYTFNTSILFMGIKIVPENFFSEK